MIERVIIDNPKKGKIPMVIGLLLIAIGLLGVCGNSSICFLSFIVGLIIFLLGAVTHWFYN